MINAIKYTVQGGVSVGWGDSASGDDKRWVVWIQDTGPDFAAAPSWPLAGTLEQASESAGPAMANAVTVGITEEGQPSAFAPSRKAGRRAHGEGIGLSIVKQLAEPLDATVEVESDVTGTIFRDLLPRRCAS